MLVVNIFAVYPLSEIGTRFEMRYILFRNMYFLTGFRITSNARWPVVQGHAAKPPDFDTFSISQSIRHSLQNAVDSKLNVSFR